MRKQPNRVGERNPNAKLNRRRVDTIRHIFFWQGYTEDQPRNTTFKPRYGWQAKLARAWGVSTSAITEVIAGRSWAK